MTTTSAAQSPKSDETGSEGNRGSPTATGTGTQLPPITDVATLEADVGVFFPLPFCNFLRLRRWVLFGPVESSRVIQSIGR
jgi:hypothetical protein